MKKIYDTSSVYKYVYELQKHSSKLYPEFYRPS